MSTFGNFLNSYLKKESELEESLLTSVLTDEELLVREVGETAQFSKIGFRQQELKNFKESIQKECINKKYNENKQFLFNFLGTRINNSRVSKKEALRGLFNKNKKNLETDELCDLAKKIYNEWKNDVIETIISEDEDYKIFQMRYNNVVNRCVVEFIAKMKYLFYHENAYMVLLGSRAEDTFKKNCSDPVFFQDFFSFDSKPKIALRATNHLLYDLEEEGDDEEVFLNKKQTIADILNKIKLLESSAFEKEEDREEGEGAGDGDETVSMDSNSSVAAEETEEPRETIPDPILKNFRSFRDFGEYLNNENREEEARQFREYTDRLREQLDHQKELETLRRSDLNKYLERLYESTYDNFVLGRLRENLKKAQAERNIRRTLERREAEEKKKEGEKETKKWDYSGSILPKEKCINCGANNGFIWGRSGNAKKKKYNPINTADGCLDCNEKIANKSSEEVVSMFLKKSCESCGRYIRRFTCKCSKDDKEKGECDLCGKKGLGKVDYHKKYHCKAIHFVSKPKTCQVCGELFPEFARHVCRLEIDSVSTMYRCGDCDRVTSTLVGHACNKALGRKRLRKNEREPCLYCRKPVGEASRNKHLLRCRGFRLYIRVSGIGARILNNLSTDNFKRIKNVDKVRRRLGVKCKSKPLNNMAIFGVLSNDHNDKKIKHFVEDHVEANEKAKKKEKVHLTRRQLAQGLDELYNIRKSPKEMVEFNTRFFSQEWKAKWAKKQVQMVNKIFENSLFARNHKEFVLPLVTSPENLRERVTKLVGLIAKDFCRDFKFYDPDNVMKGYDPARHSSKCEAFTMYFNDNKNVKNLIKKCFENETAFDYLRVILLKNDYSVEELSREIGRLEDFERRKPEESFPVPEEEEEPEKPCNRSLTMVSASTAMSDSEKTEFFKNFILKTSLETLLLANVENNLDKLENKLDNLSETMGSITATLSSSKKGFVIDDLIKTLHSY